MSTYLVELSHSKPWIRSENRNQITSIFILKQIVFYSVVIEFDEHYFGHMCICLCYIFFKQDTMPTKLHWTELKWIELCVWSLVDVIKYHTFSGKRSWVGEKPEKEGGRQRMREREGVSVKKCTKINRLKQTETERWGKRESERDSLYPKVRFLF